ncbi:hypothetical protein [Salipiger bermudensis]|uniref:hypothetical protein n=1 Tax=Salipiger bermudensis TaxID=344736 RepID=UPI0002F86560|nr:hypothetical protein [Salipiger bermudensis]
MSPAERIAAVLAPVERPLLREYSVKAIGDALREGRFLVSFPRGALGPGPSRVLRGMLDELGAPAEGVARLEPLQSRAASLHFGLEPEGAHWVLKCYLEFADRDRPEPGLAFLALKWRDDGAFALSDYRDAGPLPAPELAKRITAGLPEGAVRDALLSLAALPTPQPLTLLDVTEPGNPRRSLDLNLTPLGATLGDHAESLTRLLGPASAPLLAREAARPLGHVAAGTARDGRPFATLYYGAHRVRGAL